MKLFSKKIRESAKVEIQKLEKTQMGKVIGGTDVAITAVVAEIVEGKKGLNAVNVKLA
jgi:hypothetical protein